jgi:hypothetical protein
VAKYGEDIDRESAFEILTAKLEQAAANPPAGEVKRGGKTAPAEQSTLEKMAENTVVKSMMRTAGNTIVRSLLGALGLGGRSTRSKKSSWF